MVVGLLVAGLAIILGLAWLPAVREMVTSFQPATGELIDAVVPLMPFAAFILMIFVAIAAIRRGGT